MGLLGDQGFTWGDMNVPAPPPEMGFNQALAALRAASFRAAAGAAFQGDPQASVYGNAAAEQQKLADTDPYAYLYDLRNKKLTGDSSEQSIESSKQSTAHDKQKMDYEKQLMDEDKNWNAQFEMYARGQNGGAPTPGSPIPGGAGAPGAPGVGGAGAGAPGAVAGAAGLVAAPPFGLTKTQYQALIAMPQSKRREAFAKMIQGGEFEQELASMGIARNSPEAIAYAQKKYKLNDEPTDTMKNTTAKVEASYGNLDTAIKNYEGLVDKHGMEWMPGEAKARLGAAHTSILMEMKNLMELGVLNGADADYITKMVPEAATGVSGWLTGSTDQVKAGLEEAKRFMARKLEVARSTGKIGGHAPAAPQVTSDGALTHGFPVVSVRDK